MCICASGVCCVGYTVGWCWETQVCSLGLPALTSSDVREIFRQKSGSQVYLVDVMDTSRQAVREPGLILN